MFIEETEIETFERVNHLFNPDSPTCLIPPSDLGNSEALNWYGIL